MSFYLYEECYIAAFEVVTLLLHSLMSYFNVPDFFSCLLRVLFG